MDKRDINYINYIKYIKHRVRGSAGGIVDKAQPTGSRDIHFKLQRFHTLQTRRSRPLNTLGGETRVDFTEQQNASEWLGGG